MSPPNGGGTDWVDRLNSVSNVEDIDGAFTRLFFLPITAFFVQAAGAVEAISNLIIAPLATFTAGLQAIVRALLGDGAARIIAAGAEASAAEISVFGIASFPAGLGIAFLGAFILQAYLSQEDTADLLPFSFTDLPFVGVEEDPEEG